MALALLIHWLAHDAPNYGSFGGVDLRFWYAFQLVWSSAICMGYVRLSRTVQGDFVHSSSYMRFHTAVAFALLTS